MVIVEEGTVQQNMDLYLKHCIRVYDCTALVPQQRYTTINSLNILESAASQDKALLSQLWGQVRVQF